MKENNNSFNVSYLPTFKKDNVIFKAKDIKAAILNDIEMLDDYDFILESHLRIAKLKKALDDVSKDSDYKDKVKDALENIKSIDKQDKITIDKSELTIGATYTTYDYSKCGHPVLDFIYTVETRFKDLRKEIEKEIQAIPQPKQEIETDFETGEINTITTGGNKNILIDSDVVIKKLQFVMSYAEHMIQDINNNNGVFNVKVPIKHQTMGIKITKL